MMTDTARAEAWLYRRLDRPMRDVMAGAPAPSTAMVLQAIERLAADLTGHDAGCRCAECCSVRVCSKRGARLMGWLPMP